jgi:zinc protease
LLVCSAAAAPAQTSSAGAVTVTRATLGNGLRVVVLRDPLAPVVSTFMNYQVGADDESITGLAHAQEHMMFRGSKTLSASQFAEATAITGGAFNANTQSEITQYFYTMPAADLDVALHLEAARAQNILDTQALWDQERGAITQEVTRDNGDADYRLYVKVLHHVLAGTPYADEGLGTVESFARQVNAPQLRAFYRAWYHPNNAIYVIAGDVDPRQTLAKVRALFGAIPRAPLPARKPVKLGPLSPASYSDQTDQPFTETFLTYRFPGYQSRDYAASRILVDVLNSRRGSLYELVADGKAVDVSAGSQPFSKAGLAFVELDANAGVDPQTALGELRAVIDGYRAGGIPADLVEAAKQRAIERAQFARNSVSGLAREWSQALAVEHRTPDDDLAAIRRVTAGDVDRVLRTYLVNETATSAYAVPKSAGQPGSGAQGGGLGAPENNTIEPAAGTSLPSWAARVLKNLQVPRRTLHPTEMTLANGIKLVVVPENVSDTVTLRGAVRNDPGIEEPASQEGVSGIAAALMRYGTTTYDRLAYQRELDNIAASVSTGLGFSLDVLTPNFDRGVQLLADGELHPSFPAGAFSIVKTREYRTALAQQESPEHQASIDLMTALYPPDDPARRFATPQSIQALTLDDVKAWYAKAYRPDLTTIVVVGNVTPARARAVVERWFGGWSAAGPRPPLGRSAVADNAPAAFTVPATGRVQASVTLAETLRLHRSDADVAALRVANTVLSGGFYASLLFHDLREVGGLVYSVNTALNTGRSRSRFTITYGCDPQNVDRAQAMALADLRRLQTAPLSSDRLARAKALLMGAIPLRQQSVAGVAGELLGYASDGLALDQGLIDARRQLAVTARDLQSAMARWIRPDGFVRVVQGPANS